MSQLTAAQMRQTILEADDLVLEEFPAPEWNLPEGLFVKVLGGLERGMLEDRWFNRRQAGEHLDTHRIKGEVLVRTLCDASGECLYSEDDIEALGAKSSAVLDRAWQAARRLNHLTKQDIEEHAGN